MFRPKVWLGADKPDDFKHVSFREVMIFLEVAQPEKPHRFREGSNMADGVDKI